MLRKSAFMNVEVLNKLYEYMDGDGSLGLFSVRPGQILNVALYKIEYLRQITISSIPINLLQLSVH